MLVLGNVGLNVFPLSAVFAVTLWLTARRMRLGGRTARAFDALLVAVVVQVGLGIATLLTVVALPIAVAHQAGALLLFTAALWVLHELRGATPTRVPARPRA